MNPVPCIARAAVLATFLCFASIPLTWATNVEGQLDPHFSGEEFDYGNAVAVQSDGRILVAGTLTDNFGTHHLGLIRLLPDGSLDTSFADDGKIDFHASPDQIVIRALTIQPDGKIVVGGYYASNDSLGRTFLAFRFNANGAIDYNFGTSGKIRVGFGYGFAEANAIALAGDGSIYLGGDVRREYSIGGPTIQNFDFAVVKLTPVGVPDANFGNQGKLDISFDQGGDDADIGTAIAVQSDGKVLLTGRVRKDAQSDEFGLVRFSAAGVPETGFGNLPQSGFSAQPGQSVFDVTGYHCHQVASAIALSEPVLGGRRIYLGGTACYLGTTTIGVIAAVADDGTLDTSFNSPSGDELVNIDPDYEAQHLTALVLQPPAGSAYSYAQAPSVLAVGYGYSQAHGNDDMLLTRLKADGSVDTGFGLNGHQAVYYDYAQDLGDDHALAAAMDGGGRLVVSGSSQRNSNGDTDMAVARLLVGDEIFHDGFEPLF